MNRAQGWTTSALVAGAVLFRSGGVPAPSQASSTAQVAAAALAEAARAGYAGPPAGPWMASCSYWQLAGAPSSSGEPAAREEDATADSEPAVAPASGDTRLATAAQASVTKACGPRNWGIPAVTGSGGAVLVAPHLTALIATVPDPIHSSMSFEFDRTIDVITEAAAESGYVTSYFWLPWKRVQAKGTEAAAPPASRELSDPTRERQPGLLILKQSEDPPELRAEPRPEPRPDATSRVASAPSKSAGLRRPSGGRVIYLFLVAQTPALGINGEQMRRALEDEAYLRTTYHAELSIRQPENEADVIGPNNSGSAASLRAALDNAPFDPSIHRISVAGNTSTEKVASVLMKEQTGAKRAIDFISFEDDTDAEEDSITARFPDHTRLAFLVESGTAYGDFSARTINPELGSSGKRRRINPEAPLTIRFPRELGTLRGAEHDEPAVQQEGITNPYLHLSLKDTTAEDSIPHYSADLSPISQEAQWMAIVRELRRRHVEVVAISATNILDQLFLAKFLHRDLPDALLVFYGSSDLFFARYSDNAAYVGSVALSAYPLTALARSGGSQRLLNFPSGWAEAFHNAVVYTLWDGSFERFDPEANKVIAAAPTLAEYSLQAGSGNGPVLVPPPLWATAVGRDGYYPLGIVAPCASSFSSILPVVASGGAHRNCESSSGSGPGAPRQLFTNDRRTYPALSWYVLCGVLSLLSIAHGILLRSASFWSASTRDLAIDHSDQPRRRAMYIHVAASMLFCMAFVTAFPIFTTLPLLRFNPIAFAAASATLLAAVVAVGLTLRVTCRDRFALWRLGSPPRAGTQPASTYAFFNALALLAVLAVVFFWVWACTEGAIGPQATHVGLFFAFCCLYPSSGVCPLVPLLILLLCWHLWAVFQTQRLAFSTNSRPRLPGRLPLTGAALLYVSDEDLNGCGGDLQPCLYSNITSLLITRRILERATGWRGSRIVALLLAIFGSIFVLFVFCLPVRSLDRFLRTESLLTYFHLGSLLGALHLNHLIARIGWHRPVTGYEFLVSALAYTLITVALAGTLRVILIWKSLRRGLLEPLERSPLRFAFNRLTNIAWTTMLRQGGLPEYWRDMARSREAMGQLAHHADLQRPPSPIAEGAWTVAQTAIHDLHGHILALRAQIAASPANAPSAVALAAKQDVLSGDDLPLPANRVELILMSAIERDFAHFAEALLSGVLEPFWIGTRMAPVEAEQPPDDDTPAACATATPERVALCEEFLALRYLSLIRAVLINLRQIMLFVSISFVLTLIAWNAYPFQPRQWIDWGFTALLFGFGACTVWIFAQMHRDPILSRITGTEINKLDASFYLRIATFGAVPVLTWLASQFPGIGSGIARLLQSGMQIAK